MKFQENKPVPTVDVNAPLRVNSSTPLVEESELDRYNRQFFIMGVVCASFIVIIDVLVLFLKLKMG